MSCKPTQELMDAYLDGELDLVRSLEIEQHLKECPSCAPAVERRRSLMTAMKTAPLAYSLPANLERDVRSALRRESEMDSVAETKTERRVWNWQNLWISLIPVASMAVAFFMLMPIFRSTSVDERLGQEVVSAHVRSLMAEHLVDIQTSDHHVVKPWFNGRLDFSPPVRDFSDHGFPLAGGRMEYLGGHAAAAIVYHRAAHPINLFVWPSKAGEIAKEKEFTRQGYHLVRWTDAGMTYWVISDVNEQELKDFVDLVRKMS